MKYVSEISSLSSSHISQSRCRTTKRIGKRLSNWPSSCCLLGLYRSKVFLFVDDNNILTADCGSAKTGQKISSQRQDQHLPGRHGTPDRLTQPACKKRGQDRGSHPLRRWCKRWRLPTFR